MSLPVLQGNRWSIVAVCVFLVALTWLVFGQILSHEFINYDDETYVYENAEVRRGLSLNGIIWAFTHIHASNWHPLTWISHMLDCQLFGLNAGGHHFTNVFLHTIAMILLFLVLRQMTGSLWRSAFVAALFAIHPLRVESVAWVAERKDVLSGVFFMLTLGAYVGYARKQTLARYLLVALVFALGLMSKPMLVMLPFVLLFLDYWPLQRQSGLQKLIIEKIPLFALSAASGVMTLIAQKHTIATIERLPLTWRIGNAIVSYVTYLWQLIWPARLTLVYSHPENGLLLWQILAALIMLVAVTAIIIRFRRKIPYALTGWFWYLIMLAPVIGVIQVGSQAHADRYTYLPHIGLYLSGTWAVVDLSKSWRHQREILAIAVASVLAILSWRTWDQTRYWRDSESVWRHALAITPNELSAHTNLGNALMNKGRTNEAIAEFLIALKLRGNDAEVTDDLGNAFLQTGEIDKAISFYQQGLDLRPDDADLHNNFGSALFRKGLLDEAIVHYQRALELWHDRAEVRVAAAHYNLGSALLQKGQIDEAIAHFQEALEIQPDDANTHYNLGSALLRKKRTGDAITQYERALQINPQSAEIRNSLAWLLATDADAALRNGSKAVALAEQAVRLSGEKNPLMFYTLAAAYAETGRFADAVAAAQRSLELANEKGDTALAAAVQKRMPLFQSRLPYHADF